MVKEIDLSAINVGEQPQQEPTLPPAGFQRDEELLKRTDELEEKGEHLANALEMGEIPHDHDALRPDRNREIQQHIRKDHLAIGANHPYLKTKWVDWKHQDGKQVWDAKFDGWQIATVKEFPEAADLRREDNTIRVGDVLLMCIRMDEYYKLQEREKEKRFKQQFGVEARIHELAEATNRRRGIRVFAGVATPELGVTGTLSPTGQAKAAQFEMARKEAVGREAFRALGNRMKQGPINGLPLT